MESYLCKDGKPISVSPLYAGDDTPENEVKTEIPDIPKLLQHQVMPLLLMKMAHKQNWQDLISEQMPLQQDIRL